MNININTIFARVTSAFNTQMDAHLRAVAESKQTAELDFIQIAPRG